MEENLDFRVSIKIKLWTKLRLCNSYLEIYVTYVEMKGFGETLEGQVICFDTKINFDDNLR